MKNKSKTKEPNKGFKKISFEELAEKKLKDKSLKSTSGGLIRKLGNHTGGSYSNGIVGRHYSE